MRILASDIGGTNARFAFFQACDTRLVALAQMRFDTRSLCFSDILDQVLQKAPEGFSFDSIDAVSVAAAGPLAADAIELTNASMRVSKSQLKKRFPHSDILLLNDFVAQAWGAVCPELSARFIALTTVPMPVNGDIAVVGAGTGFGAAFIRRSQGAISVSASEFGHLPQAFDPNEIALSRFLLERTGAPSVEIEHVLSGEGLCLVHEFLTGQCLRPEELTREANFAQSDTCALFARLYARAVRSAALASLAPAVVISGGMAAKTPILVTHPEFSKEMRRARDNHLKFIDSISIRLNAQDSAGLFGAARAAVETALAKDRRNETC